MSKLIFLTALLIINANPALLARLREGRIVGGTHAFIKNFPYQVSLELDGVHYCGGSIISAKYILTAGHCIRNLTPDQTKVRVGSSWKNTGGSLYQVKRFIRHEFFMKKGKIYVNDIALIELNKPIVFHQTRKPIELFDAKEEIPLGAKGVVSGWGRTGSIFYLGLLKSVIVPIVPTALCKKVLREAPGLLEFSIPDGQICAGFLGGSYKGPCRGDSGGPLVIQGRLAGVAAWVTSCTHGQFPGVYTEVSHYRDWIKKNAGV